MNHLKYNFELAINIKCQMSIYRYLDIKMSMYRSLKSIMPCFNVLFFIHQFRYLNHFGNEWLLVDCKAGHAMVSSSDRAAVSADLTSAAVLHF